jgi:hypothetical protein
MIEPTFRSVFRLAWRPLEPDQACFRRARCLDLATALAGGWLGDRWEKQSGKGYLLISGWGCLIGTPFAVWPILASGLTGCLSAIFIAEFFLFLNTGQISQKRFRRFDSGLIHGKWKFSTALEVNRHIWQLCQM